MLLSTLHIQMMGQKTFWVMTALLLKEMPTALLQPRHASERDSVGKGEEERLDNACHSVDKVTVTFFGGATYQEATA